MSERANLAVITRLSRSHLYLERVLEGLCKQTKADLTWILITPIPLSAQQEQCVARAQAKGIVCQTLLINPELSLGARLNFGIQATHSPFILVHDDDDALCGDFTAPALTFLQAHFDIIGITCSSAVLYENAREADTTPNQSKKRARLDFIRTPANTPQQEHAYSCLNNRALLPDNLIATNALIYRRSAYESTKGYLDIDIAEDWHFNLALAQIGKIAVLNTVYACVYIRVNKNNKTANENTVSAQKNAHLKAHALINKQYNIDKLTSAPNGLRAKIKRRTDRLYYQACGRFLRR